MPTYWEAIQWTQLHLLLYRPWGFFLPMKVLYLVVLWHSWRMGKTEQRGH